MSMNDLHRACPLMKMVNAGYNVCLGSDDPAIHQNQPIWSRILSAMNQIPKKTVGIITVEEQVAGYLLGKGAKYIIVKMRQNASQGRFFKEPRSLSSSNDTLNSKET